MCGIVGVLSWSVSNAVDKATLVRMRDTMVSRGPDDSGIFLHGGNRVTIGLGHRRLSIIDLSARGRQPMPTTDGKHWIVFNGEIFNYRELKEELTRTAKCVFRTDTDTEVILYAIREWGLRKSLTRFRGMYAFAFFDKDEESLTLVRDPLGVKPLYFYKDDKLFVFGSEIKAILAHPSIRRGLDLQSLSHYLTFANAPAPDTMFDGIMKLEAGTCLKLSASGATEQHRYWDPTAIELRKSLDERECVEELRRLLRQAVARRMVSDVPFGVFLSGGADSSLNVALMAEMMNRPVETYSVGIRGDRMNEFEYAREVANRFGTNHHEVVIDDSDFVSFFDRMAYIQDEPLADPVCVPLYYISKLARESGTLVIQVGEGSDEIFGGYGMYHQFAFWDRYAYKPYTKLPRFVKKTVYAASKSFDHPVFEDASRRALASDPLFIGNAVAFWDSEKQRLFRDGFSMQPSSSALIRDIEAQFSLDDPLLRTINVELKNRLPELLLMRVDKMTMANSIESRVPFLDEDVVEYALSIPSSLKFRAGEAKYILKKAAESIIPNQTIYRKKTGFCGSATNMLTGKITGYARDVIMNCAITHELFRKEYVEQLFVQHRQQPRFNSFKIWNLMNLALWYNAWFEETQSTAAAA